jgi:hypothetical protein
MKLSIRKAGRVDSRPASSMVFTNGIKNKLLLVNVALCVALSNKEAE